MFLKADIESFFGDVKNDWEVFFKRDFVVFISICLKSYFLLLLEVEFLQDLLIGLMLSFYLWFWAYYCLCAGVLDSGLIFNSCFSGDIIYNYANYYFGVRFYFYLGFYFSGDS